MRESRWFRVPFSRLLIAALIACSSDDSIVDGQPGDASKDGTTGNDGGSDGTIADVGDPDTTISDAGPDATLSDGSPDATILDAGPDSTLKDAGPDVAVADACSDAAFPDGAVTTLVSSAYGTFVAIDGTNVYWGGNAVQYCAIGGCGGTPTKLVTGLLVAYGIAVDSTNVYWGDTYTPLSDGGLGLGNVQSCAIAGCDGGATTLASAQGGPLAVAVDGTNVYWVNRFDGTVMQCAKGGCSGTPTVLASGQDGPWGIAVDSTNVYWTNTGMVVDGGVDGGGSAGLWECAIGGCGGTPTALSPYGAVFSVGVAANGGNVYWTFGTGSVGVVVKTPTDGGTTTILSKTEDGPEFIAVDGTNAYWTNDVSSGRVMKCSVNGCCLTPTPIAFDSALGIAVDSTNVYWAANGLSPAVRELTPK